MANIKDKIAKLLALADSPNENEAKEALLMARRLMAEHKLRPSECKKYASAKVIHESVGVTCTAMTAPWVLPLSAVVAEHYCCKAFRTRPGNRRTYTVGLVGLEDDFEVCKSVFLYAYDCVMSYITSHIEREPYETASEYREMCNAYGYGFTRGLQQAYKAQAEENQEWGLVMVVPQPVLDACAGHKKASKNPGVERRGGYLEYYRSQGYKDGTEFKPGTRIQSGALQIEGGKHQ